MAYLVEIPVEGGGQLRVQASEEELAGALELAAVRPGEVAVRARESLEHALDDLKPAISATVKRLRALAPDEMSVEFGLVLTAESGAIIAKGSAEVHFTVALTWKRSEADEADAPVLPGKAS